ncbi:hypothetical protein MBM_04532 [Drepanopeziza brunnea f. sp. 'multigermtubi' MB_m1]|uniref:Uncharacterized protein n=1 Tax=Marssonina brunnea f. sp. multigermtubi (strain MB_m1) TaxID=1072389 RepID=K1WH79_MARBU|nr:uncharacterized protein MBM_04532 [Drepanopeziza brunnea f. sp. 'multigermtubi' MB_m1]EKD16955.1 hypothetical protein MBM_04532 [Drepanopeziza brunnea f. sp. 'multigermtubi' MB_m1]
MGNKESHITPWILVHDSNKKCLLTTLILYAVEMFTNSSLRRRLKLELGYLGDSTTLPSPLARLRSKKDFYLPETLYPAAQTRKTRLPSCLMAPTSSRSTIGYPSSTHNPPIRASTSVFCTERPKRSSKSENSIERLWDSSTVAPPASQLWMRAVIARHHMIETIPVVISLGTQRR